MVMLKLLLPAALAAVALFQPEPNRSAEPFERVAIFLEYNATDEDAEVVVDLKADAPLERLTIIAPDDRKVLRLGSSDLQQIGINELILETTEPSLQEVLAAYPPGVYRFVGRTHGGQVLFSTATLSHQLPAAPQFLHPLDGATGVPINGASASWTSPPAASYLVELEQEDIGIELLTNVLGTTTSLAFPNGWLAPGREHQIGVGLRAANGNLVVTEIQFTAAQ
jgi:hypothetical protein